jgi:hypothetical protein
MRFASVSSYWDERYLTGKGSGKGSRGRQAWQKAAYINRVIVDHAAHRVIDWGCGDGVVASKLEVPSYYGLDVSPTAVNLCRQAIQRHDWHFFLYDGFTSPQIPPGDLALSLDVIFHLVDDSLYQRHLELLFASAPVVCIASSNVNETGWPHVRHRAFLKDVPREWYLLRRPATNEEIGFWVFRNRP